MSRRQAQSALANAAALFNSEVLATTRRPTARPRGGSGATIGIGQELLLQSAAEGDIALYGTAGLAPFGSWGPGSGDSRLAAKIGSKIHDLFAIGEQIAKASGAKQLQIQVGLPWTAAVALSWDLP
jgi:hypothetical protein